MLLNLIKNRDLISMISDLWLNENSKDITLFLINKQY